MCYLLLLYVAREHEPRLHLGLKRTRRENNQFVHVRAPGIYYYEPWPRVLEDANSPFPHYIRREETPGGCIHHN